MADYELRVHGVFHRPTGMDVRPQDEAWQWYDAWRALGNVADPMPVPLVSAPTFDHATEGINRRDRALARLARTDPTEALLRKVGLKR